LVARAKSLNHVSRRFWADLDDPKMPARERRGQVNTTRNRLEALLMDRDLNLFVGTYHSSLKLREWLDEGKMILIDLGHPLPRGLGIDIGNVIMSQVMTETFLRTDETKQTTWRLVVDEFHEFVGANFATVITEARSYNVFPVMAHQDRSQLDKGPERVLRSAVGHAGLTCLLPTSPEDRIAYASLYGRDQADLILGLDRFKALVTLMDGLTGARKTEVLVLDDWWGEPIPGQLAELQQAAYPHTIAKKEIVATNNARYWDRLDAASGLRRETNRDTVEPKANGAKPPRPRRQKTPTGESSLQPGPGQTETLLVDPVRKPDAAGPRSSPLLDGPPDF
jgi:hypothetical protein